MALEDGKQEVGTETDKAVIVVECMIGSEDAFEVARKPESDASVAGTEAPVDVVQEGVHPLPGDVEKAEWTGWEEEVEVVAPAEESEPGASLQDDVAVEG